MNVRAAVLLVLVIAFRANAAAAAPQHDSAIERAIDAMTDDEKIAQLMIAGFAGKASTRS